MLKGSTLLVTGGTGSFGARFVERTLALQPKRIIIFSRDEMKQWQMCRRLGDDPRLRFVLGDVRDREQLETACTGVDYLIHAAALKIIPVAESNPFECVKTNVIGTMNVISSAIAQRVRKVIGLSTDKACNPANIYGATKLCADKLLIASGTSTDSATRFAVVRYGNVIGSRGSVIPLFQSLRHVGEIPVTDESMTRFMLTKDQTVELVWHALEDSSGGEIYVKKMPSMRILDVARTIAPGASIKIVGTRPGEKLHEELISEEEAPFTYEYERYFKIVPRVGSDRTNDGVVADRERALAPGRRCPVGFSYRSETNTEWLSPTLLSSYLAEEAVADDPIRPPHHLV